MGRIPTPCYLKQTRHSTLQRSGPDCFSLNSMVAGQGPGQRLLGLRFAGSGRASGAGPNLTLTGIHVRRAADVLIPACIRAVSSHLGPCLELPWGRETGVIPVRLPFSTLSFYFPLGWSQLSQRRSL